MKNHATRLKENVNLCIICAYIKYPSIVVQIIENPP